MKHFLFVAVMILVPLSLSACSGQSKNMDQSTVKSKSLEGEYSKRQRK